MSIVISRDKYYKEIASKIRNVFNTETSYKPSEMSENILNMKDIVNTYSQISNGAVYTESSANIIGDKMYPGMFANTNIDSIELPETITEISDYAFHKSTISNINLHNGITRIGSYAFYRCENLYNIDIPNSIVHIGDHAFYNTNITSINFPNGLISIGEYAFFYCRNIDDTNIVIPSSVTEIGGNAFNSSYITKIDIYGNISILNSYIFGFCTKLTTVILRNTESVCTLGEKAFCYTHFESDESYSICDGTGYVYVPAALVDSYKADSSWSAFVSQIRAIEDYPDICGTTTTTT